MLIWLEQIIRSFFFTIDNSLFGFIETLYNLLILISRTTILTHSDIKEFAERIQALLGVFMLFKVSFSIITYVINPDEFSDKSKGFAKIGQNIIISLVLLVVTPYLFGWAYDLQAIILEDNAIPNLLFSSKNDYNFIDNGGQRLSFSVMIPFFRPDTGLSELSSCYQLYDSSVVNKFNSLCKEQLEAIVSDGKDDELDARVINNYTTGVEYRNYGLTFRQEAATFLTNNNQFVFRYWIILSTAAAIVVILLLITFAMDIALRSVKLAFLQLIAPIPIISYIDPKQGKDGMFKKWYTMCFSTYVSLFVRLLALYFGFYLIDIVINRGFSDVITGKKSQWGWFTAGMWINLFMIIGILMFIKQLPKILEGFGIKLDGGGKFTLNPFKKFEEEAIGGKKIMGAAGGVVSGVADRGARIMTAQGAKNKFKAAAGGFIGIPGAALRGARNGKGYMAGKEAQNSVNRRLREGRIKGLTPAESYLDYVGSKFGLDDATLEREGTYIHENEVEIAKAKQRIDDNTRSHTLHITELEQQNAVRKDTLSKLKNVKAKGDAITKNNDDYLTKKADFGYNTSDDTLLSYYSRFVGSGMVTSGDINLSDGSKISKGTVVDGSMIARIRQSRSKDYTLTNSANRSNLEIMKKGQILKSDVYIGTEFFKKGTKITGDVVARANQAANLYEKYAKRQVQNAFITNNTGANNVGGSATINKDDRQVFLNLQDEYISAANDANTSINTYNITYSASVGNVSNTISDFDSFDKELKNLEHGRDVTDMAVDSEKIERSIADEKRIIEDIKHNQTVNYKGKDGKITQNMALDEAELLLKPRKDEHKDNVEKHQQRRSLIKDTMGNKG